jgi:hypothetical protein
MVVLMEFFRRTDALGRPRVFPSVPFFPSAGEGGWLVGLGGVEQFYSA